MTHDTEHSITAELLRTIFLFGINSEQAAIVLGTPVGTPANPDEAEMALTNNVYAFLRLHHPELFETTNQIELRLFGRTGAQQREFWDVMSPRRAFAWAVDHGYLLCRGDSVTKTPPADLREEIVRELHLILLERGDKFLATILEILGLWWALLPNMGKNGAGTGKGTTLDQYLTNPPVKHVRLIQAALGRGNTRKLHRFFRQGGQPRTFAQVDAKWGGCTEERVFVYLNRPTRRAA